jgi:hypothetical protein
VPPPASDTYTKEQTLSKRRSPLRCTCGGKARWDAALFPDNNPPGGWECPECHCWFDPDAAEYLGLESADGWIRSPDDVVPRLVECWQRAEDNPWLKDFDLDVYRLYLKVATEHRSVQIVAADRWVGERLEVTDHKRVSRARARLESFNHVKRLQSTEVTMYALQEHLAERRAKAMRMPVILEVRRGPAGWPGCAECGGEIPDIQRVSKKYCSDTCRVRAFRREGIDTTELDTALSRRRNGKRPMVKRQAPHGTPQGPPQ